MGNVWTLVLLPLLTAGMTSTGFWAYLQRKSSNKNEFEKLTLGLAYEKIVSMGMSYIERGWITEDEYQDYLKYLYEPYKALGGNGVTQRVVAEVSSLPLRSRAYYATLISDIKSRRTETPLLEEEQLAA
jgi:hypothetical protein